MSKKHYSPLHEYKLLKSDITYKLRSIKGRFFVYILMLGDSIVYIGRTRNLCTRLYSHKYNKDFTSVLLYEFDAYTDTKIAENYLIHFFKPNLNINK